MKYLYLVDSNKQDIEIQKEINELHGNHKYTGSFMKELRTYMYPSSGPNIGQIIIKERYNVTYLVFEDEIK